MGDWKRIFLQLYLLEQKHLFYLFIHLFMTVLGLSLVAASGSYSCCGAWPLAIWVSVVVVHRLSCPTEHGIFPDQGSNLCPLHWQVDS